MGNIYDLHAVAILHGGDVLGHVPDGSGRSEGEGGLMFEKSLRKNPYLNSVAIAISKIFEYFNFEIDDDFRNYRN